MKYWVYKDQYDNSGVIAVVCVDRKFSAIAVGGKRSYGLFQCYSMHGKESEETVGLLLSGVTRTVITRS